MTVNISNLTIATPLAASPTNPVALEINGAEAIERFPRVVKMLDDGSIQLWAPTKGASSKSTHRTRCEWSETQNWTIVSAPEHWSRQTMSLTKVNSAKKVVVSQMHVRGDDSPPLKVFWNKGNITFGFRQTYDQTNPVNSTLLQGVPLGAVFDVIIHAAATGEVKVTARCNGTSRSSSGLQLDHTWTNHLFEFHGGIYNQIDYCETTPAEDGSVCIISALSLSHG